MVNKARDAIEREELFASEALPLLDQMYAGAMRLARNREDAEDLVQDLYLTAYDKFDGYQPGTNIRAWMFRILTNLYISRYRKMQREPKLADSENVEEWHMVQAARREGRPMPGEDFFETLPDETIREAFQKLPENYRLALYLVDVQGFTHKETAQMLDIPAGTVMSRVHRGRKMLRNALDTYEEVSDGS
ncbi:sigma-70 family RNA polymerase sigma factor [Scrofimicrobium canadense]|nr:sigma-70 family RNA polymerase sigma factor [Scrofimicrobium canadense]